MSYYDDYSDNHSFTFRFHSSENDRNLEMTCSEFYLNEIFARFKEFLQGCGYEIHGDIAVVDYDSDMKQDVEQTKFDFSNIPNNNWPFGGIPRSSNMNDTIPEQTETISIEMPGTLGSPTVSFR